MAEGLSSKNSDAPGRSGSRSMLNDASVIGRIIVDQGLAESEAVKKSLLHWRELGSSASDDTLTQVMVREGIVTPEQLKRVRTLAEQQRSVVQQIPGYQLLDRLGAGAMGVVFKARQLSLDRIVAIKILPKKFMSDPLFVERFYAEGRAAAKLNHPNIVQAFDVGHAGEFHYFVMEFVEGFTVFDHLKEHGRYDEQEAIRVVTQVAQALKHATEKSLIHRDVKPKNIMITPQGVAKLADMGLARIADDHEMAKMEAGKAVGTPYYISPEQIRGVADVDSRADIYGLGATFYHMVTGRVPFDGPNPSAVMHKHLKEDLVLPDHINKNLSASAGQVIEVMMAKDRNKRYQSFTDLIEDLKSVAAGDTPLHATKTSDFSSLSSASLSIESAAATESKMVEADYLAPPPSVMEQPIFWITVVSVILNVVLIGLLIYLLRL